jgi:hypothetical protein
MTLNEVLCGKQLDIYIYIGQRYSIPRVWNSYSIPEPTRVHPVRRSLERPFPLVLVFFSGLFGAHLCRGLFSSARLFLRAVRFVAHTRLLAPWHIRHRVMDLELRNACCKAARHHVPLREVFANANG